MEPRNYNILIASYLEPKYIDQIAGVSPRIKVIYRPDLLPKPRYHADHTGQPFKRTAAQESEWIKLLGEADILFDFDRSHLNDLPGIGKEIRWIQGTSSGIHELIRQHQLHRRMPDTIFTNAKGIHAQPLAEFAMMSILFFTKKIKITLEAQVARQWQRFASTDLEGRNLLIVGLGEVGQEIARVAKAFRMHVTGVKRHTEGLQPSNQHVDELFSPDHLDKILPVSEFVVLIAPHTPETEGMFGQRQFELLPKGAIFINISRGALVDEKALLAALKSGHLGGASLDVFAEEPLPPDSPFWSLPNVLVSPHSGSTSDRENQRLTDLFCKNLDRFLLNAPLINVVNAPDIE